MTPPFGSTLSARGFVAIRDAGFTPLRQVQGTAIVSLGWQRRPSRHMRGAYQPLRLETLDSAWSGLATKMYYARGADTVQQYLNEGGWFELEERTAAYNSARDQALARLRDAAREAGAFAVVDARVRRGRFANAAHTIEFTALGTAIGSDRFDLDESEPIPLASLGGGDLWKLAASGHWPLGLVGGTSVVFVVSGFRTKFARFRLSRRSWRNQEYEDYTEGLRAARLHALGRLRLEAQALRATGVLGIEVEVERHEERDDNLMVTVDVLGNAIVPIEQAAPPELTYALGLRKA
jgi:uncharacterized protein YbjQ (UPF0145 family)